MSCEPVSIYLLFIFFIFSSLGWFVWLPLEVCLVYLIMSLSLSLFPFSDLFSCSVFSFALVLFLWPRCLVVWYSENRLSQKCASQCLDSPPPWCCVEVAHFHPSDISLTPFFLSLTMPPFLSLSLSLLIQMPPCCFFVTLGPFLCLQQTL